MRVLLRDMLCQLHMNAEVMCIPIGWHELKPRPPEPVDDCEAFLGFPYPSLWGSWAKSIKSPVKCRLRSFPVQTRWQRCMLTTSFHLSFGCPMDKTKRLLQCPSPNSHLMFHSWNLLSAQNPLIGSCFMLTILSPFCHCLSLNNNNNNVLLDAEHTDISVSCSIVRTIV